MHPGEKLILFSGNNCEYSATISAIHKKKVTVIIDAVEEINRESPRLIHLAQAVSKGERMELVIQKAVELGVTSITPLFTERSIVRLDADRLAKKHAQWQAIAIAACEQSGRNIIPSIGQACFLNDYLQQSQATLKLVLYPHANITWRDYTFAGDIALLIGPEGGLTKEEIFKAQTMQFKPLSLGPRILRTETAAITALSVLQAVSGDL
ncbi:RNA methyltransferase, RsmE family [Legionella oakridgensis ATCC 33761 = DSM 21215]|uniref:Ribosomal RNA small subunit methyltransferase E n=3 Tax=Legionella oakridgensis TaxID=29423 RepID=W0BI27_9GAMM|nr:RNA methyltransferase, RsmE family [Legionella oakridgensis ATCC 33761 = DSM 21215]ETO92203.1 16S rRNA m(3)U-1498 methyltransferase [Legionella oakridgensis RV-2-2007]KTD38988.1 16S rRNA methyltransferase [Legionella oakridgensis]STY21284.1 16S rRNA methyltransferase [Legionella longbeachae]